MSKLHHSRILRDFEGPILYLLAGVAVAVSILVYGATKLRSSSGLFDEWRSVFGFGFGVGMFAVTIAILAINRRWLAIAGVIVVFALTYTLGLSPTRATPLKLDEYLAIANAMALLSLSLCFYYDLWES